MREETRKGAQRGFEGSMEFSRTTSSKQVDAEAAKKRPEGWVWCEAYWRGNLRGASAREEKNPTRT
jgi:hypothetical protein